VHAEAAPEMVEDPAEEAAEQAAAALRGMEEGRPGRGAGMVEVRPDAIGSRPDPREWIGGRRQRGAPATAAAGSASSIAAMSDPSWRMRRSK